MKGLGFIIPNADFSNSPLGKVNFYKSNEEIAREIVDEYNVSIGTVAFDTALYNMVLSMLNEELWDKTKTLFPILGSNLTSKGVNLKNSSAPMQLLANASIGENSITFVNTISVGTPTAETTFSFNEENQRSILMKAVATRTTNAKTTSSLTSGVSTSNNSDYEGMAFYFAFQSSMRLNSKKTSETLHRYAYTQDTNTAYLHVDGVEDGTFSGTWNTAVTYTPNTMFGTTNGDGGTAGETITDSASLINGSLYYYCLGNFTNDELQVMDGILSTFVEAVGK